jgi:hypothetical protein
MAASPAASAVSTAAGGWPPSNAYIEAPTVTPRIAPSNISKARRRLSGGGVRLDNVTPDDGCGYRRLARAADGNCYVAATAQPYASVPKYRDRARRERPGR